LFGTDHLKLDKRQTQVVRYVGLTTWKTEK